METTGDKLRAFLYAIAVHLACIGLMFAGLLWSAKSEPVSVAGGSIEATLVAAPSQASSTARATPTPPKPEPKPEPRETAPPPHNNDGKMVV